MKSDPTLVHHVQVLVRLSPSHPYLTPPTDYTVKRSTLPTHADVTHTSALPQNDIDDDGDDNDGTIIMHVRLK